MWNAVQMDDRRWYGVDVTWNDPDTANIVYTDYLLVGSATAVKGAAFSHSHVALGNLGDSTGVISFAYPALSANAYTPLVPSDREMTGDVNGDGTVNTVDARLILQFIVGKNPLPDSDAFVRADVNGDGIVNTIDARLILQYIVGKADALA